MQPTLADPQAQIAALVTDLEAELAAMRAHLQGLCADLAAKDAELSAAYALLAVWMPESESLRTLRLLHGGAA